MNPISAIRNYIRKQKDSTALSRIEDTRAQFSVRQVSGRLAICHSGTVIHEFGQGATQKDMMETLNHYRDVAANNI